MKILVIRVGRTGDIVMLTPALKAILDKWPEAEVHMVTSADGKRVLNGFHERLKKLIIYNRKGLQGLLTKRKVKQEINEVFYDKIFCFELNKSFLRLLDGQSAQIKQIGPEQSVVNYSQRCLKLVFSEDEFHEQWLYLPVSQQAIQMVDEQLQEHDITGDDFVIGLHPSFSGLSKLAFRNQQARAMRSWPAEHFAKLAILFSEYAESHLKKLFIIMDIVPEDRDLGESIAKLSGGRVIVLVPPLNFERYKAMLRRMNLLITTNTGPMHIAAAFGTNLVALFAGHDPRECSPYVPKSQFKILRAEDMPDQGTGLAAITPETVFDACLEYLNIA